MVFGYNTASKGEDSAKAVDATVKTPVGTNADEGQLVGADSALPGSPLRKSELMSKRTLLWTSTPSPANSVGKALQQNVPQLSSQSQKGIPVLKVTSRGQWKPRVLTVSKDKFALFCTHSPIKSSDAGVLQTVASKMPLPPISRKGVVGFIRHQELRERYVRYIDVADIDFVQVGVVGTQQLENTRSGNQRLKGKDSALDVKREQIVSIGHHGSQTLDLLIENQATRKQLVECVKKMRETYRMAIKGVSNEATLLRYIWYDVDSDRDGKIAEKEFIKILARINFDVKKPYKLYRQFIKDRGLTNAKKEGLAYSQVMALLQVAKNAKSKSMANQIWDDVFGSDIQVVSASDFLKKFSHGIQGESTKTLDDVEALFEDLNSMELNLSEGEPEKINYQTELSRGRFEAFLYDDRNDAYDPSAVAQGPSADLPMSAYWINTSHNTYLTGDQLQSSSSVEMYMRALRRGCKCLELDCWDGEKLKKDKCFPVVFHGHTLTSKILFADIIQVVKAYMDETPDTYPVILSLENHCSRPYQRELARILKETLGQYLYIPGPGDTTGNLPSPGKLVGKVVIKGKRPPDDENAALVEDEAEDDPYNTSATVLSVEVPSPKAQEAAAKPPKIIKELASMTLFHGAKYKSFEKSIDGPASHMHSISESKIGKILTKAPSNTPMWRKYNRGHMTRTYPAGTRVDSSNYNPVLAWSLGCQMVALNFQTNDTALILNDGLYRSNAGRGYVAKPASIMTSSSTFQSGKSITLKVRVLSGSALPKPKGEKIGETIDPYISVTIHDVKHAKDGQASWETASHTTSVVHDNGFCPVWNEKRHKEFAVHSPEFAFIQFSLNESDVGLDDKVAHAAIPIASLRNGYRSIQLLDPNGTRSGAFTFASLLVDIQMA